MKIFYLLLAALLASIYTKAQQADPFRDIVNQSLEKMEQHSLHRKKIDWAEFKREVYHRTKGIQDTQMLVDRFTFIFKALNDYHGAISTAKLRASWKQGAPQTIWSRELDSGFRHAVKLKAQRLGDIGYFRMPSNGAVKMEQIQQATQRLADTLCKITPSTLKGLIIDLRLNGGGNVWPMLAVLGPILGDGPIGGIQYVDGRQPTTNFIQNGEPFGNSQFYSVPNPKCSLGTKNIPVVVLVGPGTASSAEKVLLSFRGRANVLILGEPTAGFVTSNTTFEVGKGVFLHLATGYMTDKKGKVYTGPIQPDLIQLGGDDFFDLQHDAKFIKARQWLAEQANER